MTLVTNIIITVLLIPWGGMILMSPMMIAAEGFRDSRSSIVIATLVISYPVLIFAVLKLLGLSYFGMNVNGWLIAAILVSGSVIFLYGLPGMLLNLQKGIPNSGYFIDETSVYLDGKKIINADPLTFEEIKMDTRYAKDRYKVFYHGKVVEGADAETFTPIEPPVDALEVQTSSDQTPVYWKDARKIYYSGEIVEGADVNSFIHFAGLYAKDHSHVFYEDKVLEEADPDRFRFIKNKSIATDERNLFIYSRRSKTRVDLDSFEVVEAEHNTFCKDKNNVYLLLYGQEDPLVKVEGADLSTFKPLERSYAVDKNHVYFYGYYERNCQKLIKLEGAKPANFVVGYDETIDSEATDGERYYLSGKEVKPKK